MFRFFKLGLIFLTFSLASFVSSAEKSICGTFDDRERSDLSAASAEDCATAFMQAEFHFPDSIDGRSAAPREEDIYAVDPTSIKSDTRRPSRKIWHAFKYE